jgi:hypothetical protein
MLQVLRERIEVRLAAYYGAIFLAWWAIWRALPPALRRSVNEMLGPVLGATPTGNLTAPFPPALPSAAVADSPQTVAILATIVCLASVVLSLPIAWVYMYTRQKKGYSQSVVHTLVLLPAIVAAISVLVRNNVALAFSLAGIVAAVRFRTSLEDSRDAVFVFAVSALGLACGVHVEFASILSVLFSAIALALWYSDFGRTPPALEGQRAEQALQRALQIANRTSQFVARVDREVLESLAPAQLDALADRVRKRRGQSSEEPSFDGELHLRLADEGVARPIAEAILKERAKRWQLLRSESEDGVAVLNYGVRLRRGLRLEELSQILERELGTMALSVTIEDQE